MPPLGRLERIRALFKSQVGSASRGLAVSSLLAVIIAGAYLARRGTLATRSASALLMLLALVGLSLWLFRQRRAIREARGVLWRVVVPTDPGLGERGLRAVGLLEASGKPQFSDSRELLDLHVERVMRQLDSDVVHAHIAARARRLRYASLALFALVMGALVLRPWELAEGANVLLASEGRAPVPLPLLELRRVRVRAPSYLREGDQFVYAGSNVTVPSGSVISVRGLPLRAGRELILTDGARDVPFTDDGRGGVVAEWALTADALLMVAARFGDVIVSDGSPLATSVLHDLPPEVIVADTPRTLQQGEFERLELEYEVEDDHGIAQIDLVLQTGQRIERRPLERPGAETLRAIGGHALLAGDPAFRAFLPIVISVRARDNNPLSDAWGTSAAITVLPTAVGATEAARYQALRRVEREIVQWFGRRGRESGAVDLARVKQALAELTPKDARTFFVPPGLLRFLEEQSRKLAPYAHTRGDLRALEEVVLDVDSAVGAVAQHDAAQVAPRLGDVAEALGVSAEGLFLGELAGEGRTESKGEGAAEGKAEGKAEGEADGRLALFGEFEALKGVLSAGLHHLAELGKLGQDLGSVGRADFERIERLGQSGNFQGAARAAYHLAARLRRPNPSFGSNSSGGVESGPGANGSGGDAEPDPRFGELAEEGTEGAPLDESSASPTSDAPEGSVPEPSKGDSAKAFRERVLRGLGQSSGRLAPAVRKYAERLLE